MAKTRTSSGSEGSDFPLWHQLVAESVGEHWRDALSSTTVDAIQLAPLYPPADGFRLLSRRGNEPWVVSQLIDLPTENGTQDQLLAELEGGANGLTLVCRNGPDAHGYGFDPSVLGELLEPVLADAVRLTLLPSATRIRDARQLAEALDGHIPPNRLITVDFGLDAPGLFAATGALRDPVLNGQNRHFSELDAFGFAGTIFRSDGRVIHEAGGTPAQELGYILSTLVFAMRSGVEPQKAAEKTLLGVAIDADQFASIAKLRAMRALHASLLSACDAGAFHPTIHAITSRRMLTRKDPNVNILRNTVAVFSAAVGGADLVTSLPHTSALGYADPFARRLARNTQLILASESNLYRVADPAAGSGLFESYTDALTEKAWAFFQQIEKHGGVIGALKSGFIQAEVNRSRDVLLADMASGKSHLTGSTIFPLEEEYSVELLDIEPRPLAPKLGAEHTCEAMAPVRLEPHSEDG